MNGTLQYRVECRHRHWPWVTLLGAVMGPVSIWLVFNAFAYPPFREYFWLVPLCFTAGLLVTCLGSLIEGQCQHRVVWRTAEVVGLLSNGLPLLLMVFVVISSWFGEESPWQIWWWIWTWAW